LLLSRPIPYSTGFSSSPLVNIGKVTNKGLELSLRATPVDRRNLTWDFGLNGSTLANKIVSMGDVTPFIDAGSNQCIKPGLGLADFCFYKIVAVDSVAKRVTVTDSAVSIGSPWPKFESGFNTTAKVFRNLRIYAQVDGKF